MPTATKQISFLKYNNYANRVTHPGDTFSDIFGEYNALTGMYANEIARIAEPKLWNPNDGITTTIVTPNNTDFSTEPDYLVVWFTVSDEIESRWFVTETVRLHQGQYQCVLRRDVFSEAWNELMNATCYIDRAILPKTNSLIFNSEPIDVNEIISMEMEIKDNTNCPWLVFYSSEEPAGGTVITAAEDYDSVYLGTKAEFEAEYSSYYIGMNDVKPEFGWKIGSGDDRHYLSLSPLSTGFAGATPSHVSTLSGSDFAEITNPELALEYSRTIAQQPVADYYNNNMRPVGTPSLSTNAKLKYFATNYANKRVYCTQDQKVYNVNFVPGHPAQMFYIMGSLDSAYATLAGLAKDKFLKDCSNCYSRISNWDARSVTFTTRAVLYTVTLSEVLDTNITYSLPTNTKTQDCPYNIWCLPYGDIEVRYETTPDDPGTPGDESVYTSVICNKELNLRTVNTILRSNSVGKVYDGQILPYCPLPQSYVKYDISTGKPYIWVAYEERNKLTNLNTLKDSGDNTVGFIFTVPRSTFERTILLDPVMDPGDYKLDSITRKYRIYAPNYSSSFEFSASKNHGVTGFNIRCTYLPGQPYIRVAPIWGGLYGSQTFTKDPRGLICQGDYSLARLTDSWINFIEQNKNFQSVFARQMSSMDVQRSVQKQQEQWGVAAGVLGGVTSGAIAGSAAGPWGALAGGIVGGVGAGITGAMDLKNSERLFQENKSYATDMHNMQLQNIQAMPVGLSRTTAFNVDNRYFPTLTVYVCTDQDMAAVISFICQRSMSVGVYGRFSSVINNTWSVTFNGQTLTDRGFIKGSIVNINTTKDTHFVDALQEEISKGVYTK